MLMFNWLKSLFARPGYASIRKQSVRNSRAGRSAFAAAVYGRSSRAGGVFLSELTTTEALEDRCLLAADSLANGAACHGMCFLRVPWGW